MFNAINNILYDKNKSIESEILSEFNPFITTKTFSFYENGKYSNYINQTLNIYGNIFENIEDTYSFYNTMIPKLKKNRLEYIKKSKSEKIDEITIPEFMSKRELDLLENLCKYNHV